MNPSPLFRLVASTLEAYNNCQKRAQTDSDRAAWSIRHEANITQWVKDFMPSGSGIDNGTGLNWQESTPNKLVFETSYHHMNDGGFYDGWTGHKVIVTPSLTSRFDLKVTGRDRNDIKDYLADMFQRALDLELEHKDGAWQIAGLTQVLSVAIQGKDGSVTGYKMTVPS